MPVAQLSGVDCKSPDSAFEFCTSQKELNAVFRKYEPRSCSLRADFSKMMVVWYFAGDTHARGVYCEEVVENDHQIELRCHVQSYSTYVEAPTQRPWGAFIIPKTTKTILVKCAFQKVKDGPIEWQLVATMGTTKD